MQVAYSGTHFGATVIDPANSPYLVPSDGSFRVADAPTAPPEDERVGKKKSTKLLKEVIGEMRELQRMLYAQDKYSLLLVFQAMDAAGKDGTVRAVMSGINPAGCEVHSFKQPSSEELDHDFLWRTAKRLPQRGRIGIFNRSYYEEVLVIKVHPNYLAGQRIPDQPPMEQLWAERYESIADHEKHIARNGTVILKFWLNVGRDEQKNRFLARIDDPRANWKFSGGDVKERGHWDKYMAAYEDAINATSKPWAPWYAVPADDKPTMRLTVARIVNETLRNMNLSYPKLPADEVAELGMWKEKLLNE